MVERETPAANDECEVRYWCGMFSISREELNEAAERFSAAVRRARQTV